MRTLSDEIVYVVYCLASEVLKVQINPLNFAYMMVGWVFEYFSDNKSPRFKKKCIMCLYKIINSIICCIFVAPVQAHSGGSLLPGFPDRRLRSQGGLPGHGRR